MFTDCIENKFENEKAKQENAADFVQFFTTPPDIVR